MTTKIKICADVHDQKKRVLLQVKTGDSVISNRFIKPGEHTDVLLYEGQSFTCTEVGEDYENTLVLSETDAVADLAGKPRPDSPTVNS